MQHDESNLIRRNRLKMENIRRVGEGLLVGY